MLWIPIANVLIFKTGRLPSMSVEQFIEAVLERFYRSKCWNVKLNVLLKEMREPRSFIVEYLAVFTRCESILVSMKMFDSIV